MRHSIYWSAGRRLALLSIIHLRCNSPRYYGIFNNISWSFKLLFLIFTSLSLVKIAGKKQTKTSCCHAVRQTFSVCLKKHLLVKMLYCIDLVWNACFSARENCYILWLWEGNKNSHKNVTSFICTASCHSTSTSLASTHKTFGILANKLSWQLLV